MTFQPVIPSGGYAGWVFLNRTLDAQQTAHQRSLQTDTDYFAEHIGEVRTVDDLLSDRRLLNVALGAFGLDDDINSTFFIGKVLREGTSNPDALANKLADKTYLKLSQAFGFGEGIPPRTQLSGFAEEIAGAYHARQFEISVGDQNEDFRLALTAQRELPDIAGSESSIDTKWYTIMGSPPLRSVFESALGLPSSFGSLDIEDQLATFKSRARRQFGSDDPSQFSDPAARDRLVQTFLLRSQIADGAQALSSANTALVLLSGIAG